MARGWESKSVEMQMEERERPREASAHRNPAAEREREVLLLTKKRLLHEIENAKNAVFRELKKRALLHVETRIKESPDF